MLVRNQGLILLSILSVATVSIGYERITRPSRRPRLLLNTNIDRINITRSTTRSLPLKPHSPTSKLSLSSRIKQWPESTPENANSKAEKPTRRSFWSDVTRSRPPKQNFFNGKPRPSTSKTSETIPINNNNDTSTTFAPDIIEENEEVRRSDTALDVTIPVQLNIDEQESEDEATRKHSIIPKQKSRTRTLPSVFHSRKRYGTKFSTTNSSLETSSKPVAIGFHSKLRNNSTRWRNKFQVASTTGMPSTSSSSLYAQKDDNVSERPKVRKMKFRHIPTSQPHSPLQNDELESPSPFEKDRLQPPSLLKKTHFSNKQHNNFSKTRRIPTRSFQAAKAAISNKTQIDNSKFTQTARPSFPSNNSRRRNANINVEFAKTDASLSTRIESIEAESIDEEGSTSPASVPQEIKPEISREKRKKKKTNKSSSRSRSKRRRSTTLKPTTTTKYYEYDDNEYINIDYELKNDRFSTSTTLLATETTTTLPEKLEFDEPYELLRGLTGFIDINKEISIEKSKELQNKTKSIKTKPLDNLATMTSTPESTTQMTMSETATDISRSVEIKDFTTPIPERKISTSTETQNGVKDYLLLHEDLHRISTPITMKKQAETNKNVSGKHNFKRNDLAEKTFANFKSSNPMNTTNFPTTATPPRVNEESSAAYAIWNFHQGNQSSGWSYENKNGQARWTVHGNDSNYTVSSAEDQVTNIPKALAPKKLMDVKRIDKNNEWLPILNPQLGTEFPSIDYSRFDDVQNVQFAAKMHELPSHRKNSKNKRKTKNNRNKPKTKKIKTPISDDSQIVLKKKETPASGAEIKENHPFPKNETGISTAEIIQTQHVNLNAKYNQIHPEINASSQPEKIITINQKLDDDKYGLQVLQNYENETMPYKVKSNRPIKSGMTLQPGKITSKVQHLKGNNQIFIEDQNNRKGNDIGVANSLENNGIRLILNNSDDRLEAQPKEWQLVGDGSEEGYALVGDNGEIEWRIKFIDGKWQAVDANTLEIKHFPTADSKYESASRVTEENVPKDKTQPLTNTKDIPQIHYVNESQDYVYLIDSNAFQTSPEIEIHQNQNVKSNSQPNRQSESYNIKDIVPNYDHNNAQPQVIFINEEDIGNILNSDFRLIPIEGSKEDNEDKNVNKNLGQNGAIKNNPNYPMVLRDNPNFAQHSIDSASKQIVMEGDYGNTEQDAIEAFKSLIGHSGRIQVWPDGTIQATYPNILQEQSPPSRNQKKFENNQDPGKTNGAPQRNSNYQDKPQATGDPNYITNMNIGRSFRKINPSPAAIADSYRKDFAVNSQVAVRSQNLQNKQNVNSQNNEFPRLQKPRGHYEATIVEERPPQQPKWKHVEQQRWKIRGHNLSIEKQNSLPANPQFAYNGNSPPPQRTLHHNTPELNQHRVRQRKNNNRNNIAKEMVPSFRKLSHDISDQVKNHGSRPFAQGVITNPAKNEPRTILQGVITNPTKNEPRAILHGVITNPANNEPQAILQGIIARSARDQPQSVLQGIVASPVRIINSRNSATQRIESNDNSSPVVINVPRKDPKTGKTKQIIVIDFSNKDQIYGTSDKKDLEIVIKNIDKHSINSRKRH